MPKKKKRSVKNIAIFVGSLGGGGAERCAVLLGNIFKRMGLSVVFVNSYTASVEYSRDISVPVFVSPESHCRRSYVLEFLHEHQIDTIIEMDHFMDCSVREAVWGVLNGFNVIVQEHSQFFLPLFFYKQLSFFQLRRVAYRCISRLTCLSEMDRNLWLVSGIKNVCVMHNPLTFSMLEKEKLKNIQHENVITFLTRLAPEKGLWDIPKLIVLIKSKVPDLKCNICGYFPNDSDKREFKRRISELGITNTLDFIGYAKDPASMLSKSKVFVCVSPVEGSPMSIAEARANGVPTVMYSLPYIELAEHGCIQVPHGDIESMSEQICKLLLDDDYRNCLSEQCYVDIEKWSDSKIQEQWAELFADFNTDLSLKNSTLEMKSLEIAFAEMHRALEYYSKWYQFKDGTQRSSIGSEVVETSMKYNKLKNWVFQFAPFGSLRYKLLKLFYNNLIKD